MNAKHAAEVEALRLAAHGLPVVIVNPAHVLGPGDHPRSSTELVRRFLRRRIPAYVDGALNVVDVHDVARGHLLADEQGEVGERYILGNRNYTLDRLFADLGRLSGVEPPAVKLPLAAALALARATAVRCPAAVPDRRARSAPPRSAGPTARRRPSASSAGRPRRTRTRSRRRSPGSASGRAPRLAAAGRTPACRAAHGRRRLRAARDARRLVGC